MRLQRSMGRRAGAIVAAVVTLGLVGGCSSSGASESSNASNTGSSAGSSAGDQGWNAIVAKAKDQGAVHFYSVGAPQQNDRLLQAFNKAYPEIDVTVTRVTAADEAKIDAEMAAGADGADVVMQSGGAWLVRNKDKFQQVDSPNSKTWPSDYWLTKDTTPVVSLSPLGFLVWNTEIFPDGFEEWDDLLAPEVKGKLGTRSQVTNAVVGVLDFLERKKGEGYLPKLAAQQPKFYTSAVPLVQAVASGEIGVSNIGVTATIKDLQALGAPIDYTISDGFASRWYAAATKSSHRPEAAHIFLDFLMSPQGQAALNGDGFGGSALPNISGAVPPGSIEALDEEKITEPVIAEWKKKFQSIFGVS